MYLTNNGIFIKSTLLLLIYRGRVVIGLLFISTFILTIIIEDIMLFIDYYLSTVFKLMYD